MESESMVCPWCAVRLECPAGTGPAQFDVNDEEMSVWASRRHPLTGRLTTIAEHGHSGAS